LARSSSGRLDKFYCRWPLSLPSIYLQFVSFHRFVIPTEGRGSEATEHERRDLEFLSTSMNLSVPLVVKLLRLQSRRLASQRVHKLFDFAPLAFNLRRFFFGNLLIETQFILGFIILPGQAIGLC
jgi:hypothetical protein